jgi:hypothetical protein
MFIAQYLKWPKIENILSCDMYTHTHWNTIGLLFATTWMEPGITVLSDISQEQILHVWNWKKLILQKLTVEWWLQEAGESSGEGGMKELNWWVLSHR